jgi:hypothetical protein
VSVLAGETVPLSERCALAERHCLSLWRDEASQTEEQSMTPMQDALKGS